MGIASLDPSLFSAFRRAGVAADQDPSNGAARALYLGDEATGIRAMTVISRLFVCLALVFALVVTVALRVVHVV